MTEQEIRLVTAILTTMEHGDVASTYGACRLLGVKITMFRQWIDALSWQDRLEQAEQIIIERLADEVITIADESIDESSRFPQAAIQRNKERVASRKWLLERADPERFGTKTKIGGDSESPLQIETIRRVIIDPAK